MTTDTTAEGAVAAEAELLLGEGWADALEAGVRLRIRGFIEGLLEAELEAALSRKRYERRPPPAGGAGVDAPGRPVGHRHGHRERRLLGTFGPVAIRVPRARLSVPGGGTTEWRNATIPAYRRRTGRADALIAGAYLAGTNTRRVRRALAALFGGAVGKDTVSRVWRKLRTDWDAWNGRPLGTEPVVRLVLDGTAVRVRLDKKATTISLLVALGVRRDGQKVLLAVKNMGGESEAAWRALLDDLVGRGLGTPELVIVDGAPGLERALAALWPEALVQRCTVHTIRTQSTIRLREALTPRRGAAQGDDMADLQAAIADDDALDDELQEGLLLGQRRLVQAAADAGAERRQARPRGFGPQLLLA
jgi:putative transposase